MELRFAAFFIVALAVLFLLYWFVIGRIFSYFSLNRAWLFSILLIALTFAAMFLQGKVNTTLSHEFQVTMLTILGIVWFSVVIVLIGEVVRKFLPQDITGYLLLGTIAIVTGISLFLASSPRIVHLELPSDTISQPVRIVQLSDLHIQGIQGNSQYQTIIREALDQHPDVILITGDIIDPGLPQKLSIDTNIPILASFGNHEFYTGENFSEQFLKNSNMIVLRSQSYQYKDITIVGVDDRAPSTIVNSVLAAAKTEHPTTHYTILMYHSPIDIEQIKGTNLVLTGHTHAGQIFPFGYLVRLQYKYLYGLYKLPNTLLYVTSGTGTWGPPMRLGTRSEIVVIDFKPTTTRI